MKINYILSKTSKIIRDNAPGILTGIGLITMGLTVAYAIKATPKANELLLEYKKNNEEKELTKIEVVKLVGKEYITSAIFAGISGACFISSLAINSKRGALLATALTLSETTLKDYIEHTVKTVGEKTEKKIRDSISEEKVNESRLSNNPVIITNKGNTFFHDILTGKDFRSDIDIVKKAINELNSEIINYNYISLNDYCYKLFKGNIALGNLLGWNTTNGLINVYFSAQMIGDEAAIVINHEVLPIQKFDSAF